MTPEQIALVQSSFRSVMPISDQAAEMFYDRLYETNPEVKPMFPTDMTELRRKLMAALATVVSGLTQPETILPTIKGLGVRHVKYGAEAAHYAPVGAALIWTLEQGLGNAFTDDVRDAWVAAYALLSGVMIEAAEEARAA